MERTPDDLVAVAVDRPGGGDRRKLAQLGRRPGRGLDRLVLQLGLAAALVDLVDLVFAKDVAACQEQLEHLGERPELQVGGEVFGVGDHQLVAVLTERQRLDITGDTAFVGVASCLDGDSGGQPGSPQ
jgi:hypothetical protein